ncbi:MAG: hypothetical protein V1679_01235 [Candidatus Peregrinibacteria bacterium]
MRKILPVIIGVLIGVAVSISVIHEESRTAEAVGWWDDVMAFGNLFEWNDVFNPSSKPKNIYKLTYDKVLEKPDSDALKEVAKQFGLTTGEAVQVLNGSVTPIFNNPDRTSAQLTIEQAYKMAEGLQAKFKEVKEFYEMQQDLDLSVGPGEIFSNGDLGDSGFDLVHDLNVIEEILFLEKSQNTVGGSFGDQLDSPFPPTEPAATLSDYIAPSGPAAVLRLSLTDDSGVAGEVLEEDICPDEDDLGGLLGDYEDRKDAEDTLKAAGDVESGETGVEGEEDASELGSSAYVAPATSGEWTKVWCEGLGTSNAAPRDPFGSTGFSSLGSLSNVVGGVVNTSVGAAASFDAGGVSAHAAICLEVKAIGKTVSSYQPGESCIMCEIKKINELMSKTLSHSLTPNKATGNLMESAKCKDSLGVFMDMQVITIPAPVPTPSTDDVIFGKNIFEEWNKFVDRYRPFVIGNQSGVTFSLTNITDFVTSNAPAGATYDQILNEVTATQLKNETEALMEIENMQQANDATNTTLFVQKILGEIRQIHSFFKGYKLQFEKIGNEVCPDIENKDSQ